jgi:hypothetical protein
MDIRMQPEPNPFTIGQRVRYMPHNAFNNPNDPLCENGRVLMLGAVPGNMLVAFDGVVRPMWCHHRTCVFEPADAPLPVIE